MALNRNHKKYIIEEFEELKRDGYTVNESSISEVSNWAADWKISFFVTIVIGKVPR